jgi:aldehyde:ferredoxin oxidoreductase
MNALNYCLHIKGYSRYGIRGEHTTLIYHMTSTRGSDHLRGLHLPWPRGPSREEYGRFFGDESVFDPDVWENKHISTVFWQHEYVIADCLERCKCGVNNYHIMCPTAASRRSIRESSKGRAEMLSAATGKVWTPEEIWTLAERVYNLERAFIVRQGITRKHDWPPPKLFSPFRVLPPTLIQSHTTGKPYEPVTRPEILNEMLNRYYSQRGWDVATGIPSYQKLEQLGLDYVAEEFRRNLPYPEWNGPPLWPLDKYPSTKIERIGF